MSCPLKNESASDCIEWLNSLWEGGTVKASLNRANLFYAVNPKPGELTMSRVKLAERLVEARTRRR